MPPISSDLLPVAVSLDVGGVLVVPDHGILGAALDAAGIVHDRSLFGPAHYRAMAAVDREASDAEDFTDYLWAFVEAIEVPSNRIAEAHDVLDSVLVPQVWCQPVPGSRPALRALADAGVRLAITSNSDGTVADLLRRHEWVQVGDGGPGVPVEVITDSGIVGVGKPDPRMFAATVDALAVAPSQVLHVGDGIRYDVVGAGACGLHAVHFDPFGLCPDDAHGHVRSLADVLSLVTS